MEKRFHLVFSTFWQCSYPPGTYHHDRRCCKGTGNRCRAWHASSECNVRSRYSNYDPVVSFMEDRIKTSGCNGCQFYFRKLYFSTISANYGYPAVIGAVLIGGLFEGTLGLFAKYWRKIISLSWQHLLVTCYWFLTVYSRCQILWSAVMQQILVLCQTYC